MKRFLYLLISFFLFVGCKKKELPLPNTGDPVFLFNGIIGDDTLNYQSGVNHIYMYTDFYKDDQSLTTVRGYFGSDTCTNCEPFLSFEAKDAAQTSGLSLSQGIALIFGNTVFTSYSLDSIFGAPTIVETFNFNANTTYSPQNQYVWNFGDGTSSTLPNPTHVFPVGSSNRLVSLILTKNGLVDSLANTIDASLNSTCRANFTMNFDSFFNNRLIVSATSGFANYNWTYGNGTTGSGQMDSTNFVTNGNYLVTLTAINPTCTSVFTKKINIPFNENNANWDYSVSDTTIINYQPRLNSSSFVITWKKDGKTYYSYKNIKGVNQSNKPIFTLTKIALYGKNEKGNNTVKASGVVDTYLYNSLNPSDSIKIKSNNLTFGVAYPD